nr:MAG TPA: hypothetical protein [Caudoviricetes sp.]
MRNALISNAATLFISKAVFLISLRKSMIRFCEKNTYQDEVTNLFKEGVNIGDYIRTSCKYHLFGLR